MTKTISALLLCLAIFVAAKAQVPAKFDNQYKTIFAKDLCMLAAKNPNLVLIDVRTAGEYSDTSQFASLNMGHLKTAVNISIDTIQKNINILAPYKNKTLVFYCSHSQRSRRVSKLLSENGYTDFYNLNGGMSQLNQLTTEEFPCKKEWLESNLTYRNLSAKDAISLVKKENGLVIVDIRPAALYSSSDSLAENNIGRIRNSINIPYTDFKSRVAELGKYKDRPIFIYSQSGDGDGARAATELGKNGFTKVYHLLSGINDMLPVEDALSIIENPATFHLADARTALSILKNKNGITIYDTRPKIEFENKLTGRDSFKNLGNIKAAVNLEEKDFSSYKYPQDKKAPILIYGRAEAYTLAQKLGTEGYDNVYVLHGLYDLVSAAFNTPGGKEILPYLVNHEGLY